MKQRLYFLLRSFIYWVAIFVVAKVAFLIYEFDLTRQTSPALWFQSIWHGLIMDVAMSSYFIIIYAAILALTFFLSGKYLHGIFKGLNIIVAILSLLILVIDLELYRNWGFHLDMTPFQYLKSPQTATASTPLSIYLLVLAIYGLALWGTLKGYRQYVLSSLKSARPYKFYYFPVFLVIGAAMVVPARGGFDLQPMNNSFVYYSSDIYANHVATNPVWNFIYALSHKDNYDKDYDCMPQAECDSYFNTLMQDNDSTTQVLNTTRPNIVMVILESFSSDLFEHPEVVPNLIRYRDEGLFFSNFYATAKRSDKGLGAILSAYPAHPGDAVMRNSSKIEKMPNIGSALKEMSYYNSFYYGGDINYANLYSYLKISRFDKITGKADFPPETYGAKWGVHDEYVFERFSKELGSLQEPFFDIIYTLSSHEPFDVPEKVIKGEKVKEKFLNTTLYTDRHLGLMVENLRQSPMWDSTLIIITADHGSNFINRYRLDEKERYHIPMIWLGGPLKEKMVVEKYGTQTDIIATLLNQLGHNSDEFIFSKDLLSSGTKGFSYFAFRGGHGYIDEHMHQVYNLNKKAFTTNTAEDKGKMPGRVLLQKSYNYFLEK